MQIGGILIREQRRRRGQLSDEARPPRGVEEGSTHKERRSRHTCSPNVLLSFHCQQEVVVRILSYISQFFNISILILLSKFE